MMIRKDAALWIGDMQGHVEDLLTELEYDASRGETDIATVGEVKIAALALNKAVAILLDQVDLMLLEAQ